MGARPHYLPEVLGLGAAALAALLLAWYAWRNPSLRANRARLALVLSVLFGAVLVLSGGILLSPIRFAILFPSALVSWTRAAALFTGGFVLWTGALVWISRHFLHPAPAPPSDRPAAGVPDPPQPTRRKLLIGARNAALALPPAAAAFAIVKRNDLRLNEVDIRIPNLAKDLQGLRLVQVSDIHLSPFLSENELARAIDLANATNAHIALVTGDLVSRRDDPLDRCLYQLTRLKAEAGVYGCLGNHEIYAGAEDYVTETAGCSGIQFLRMQSSLLRFGGALLNLAGVDYQRRYQPYLTGAAELIAPGSLNVLLSHNPDVFPVAARQGFDLTVAGHTHGGQVNVEILQQNLNVARFYTPYVYGLYEKENRSIFVTRGIGTVGVPARFNAPPEIALIRLCAT